MNCWGLQHLNLSQHMAAQHGMHVCPLCSSVPRPPMHNACHILCPSFFVRVCAAILMLCCANRQLCYMTARRLSSVDTAYGNDSPGFGAGSSMDMTPIITTHDMDANVDSSTEYQGTPSDITRQRLSSIQIRPTLNSGGKAATVVPAQVVWTDWKDRDTTDVAACLSGALLKASNMSLLVSQAALAVLLIRRSAADSCWPCWRCASNAAASRWQRRCLYVFNAQRWTKAYCKGVEGCID
jgi:hypothetical protein